MPGPRLWCVCAAGLSFAPTPGRAPASRASCHRKAVASAGRGLSSTGALGQHRTRCCESVRHPKEWSWHACWAMPSGNARAAATLSKAFEGCKGMGCMRCHGDSGRYRIVGRAFAAVLRASAGAAAPYWRPPLQACAAAGTSSSKPIWLSSTLSHHA